MMYILRHIFYLFQVVILIVDLLLVDLLCLDEGEHLVIFFLDRNQVHDEAFCWCWSLRSVLYVAIGTTSRTKSSTQNFTAIHAYLLSQTTTVATKTALCIIASMLTTTRRTLCIRLDSFTHRFRRFLVLVLRVLFLVLLSSPLSSILSISV